MGLRFQRAGRPPILGLVLLLAGCGGNVDEHTAGGTPDAASFDASTPDASSPDASSPTFDAADATDFVDVAAPPAPPMPKPCVVTGDRLVFGDPVVDQGVHDALGLPAGAPVTPNDTFSLHTLFLQEGGVTTLDGLECLLDLQSLRIAGGTFDDLRPLAGLPSLRSIYLSNARISDISPLSLLRDLDFVYLDSNLVEDTRPLIQLRRLFNLSLLGNHVTDVRPLLEMPWLGELLLDDNPIDCSDPEQKAALGTLEDRISKFPPAPAPLPGEEASLTYGFIGPCKR